MPAAAGGLIAIRVRWGTPYPVKNLFGILHPQSDINKEMAQYYSATHKARMASLRPGLIRSQYKEDYDYARSLGADFQYICAGVWDRYWWTPSNPPNLSGEPYTVWATAEAKWAADAAYWQAKITAGEKDLLDHICFEFWSEPENLGASFWRGTASQFYELCWRMATQYKNVLGPRARMVGPASSDYNQTNKDTWGWQIAEQALYSRDLEMFAYDSHHLRRPWDTVDAVGPNGEKGLAAEMKQIDNEWRRYTVYNRYFVNVQEIRCSEVGMQNAVWPAAGEDFNVMPAIQLGMLDQMERGLVDKSAQAVFSPHSDTPSISGLVDPTTAEPRACWWLQKWIADGRPGRVAGNRYIDQANVVSMNDKCWSVAASRTGAGGSTTTDGTDPFMMFATYHQDSGNLATDPSTGFATVIHENIRAHPRFRFSNSVRCLYKKLVPGTSTLPTGPAVITTTDYTIDANGNITIPAQPWEMDEVIIHHLTNVP